MKKFIFGLVFIISLIVPASSFAAVAFDNDKDCGTTNPCSYTSSGSNGFIEIALGVSAAGTTVTVDGSPTMLAQSKSISGGGVGNDYYIFTTAGTHTIQVTGTDNGMCVASWNGVASVDATSTSSGTASGGDFSQSITPSGSNTWATWMNTNGDTSITAVTNFTVRVTEANAACGIGDSNGTVTAGVGFTQTASSVASSFAWQGVQLTLAPVASVTVPSSPPLARGMWW